MAQINLGNRLTDLENRLEVAKGGEDGEEEEWIETLELANTNYHI